MTGSSAASATRPATNPPSHSASGVRRDRPDLWLEATKIRSVMTQPVLTAVDTQSLLDAAQVMRRGHVSGLPVLDREGRLVGVVSEKDILADLDRSAGLGKVRGVLDLLLDLDGRPVPSKIEPCLQRLHRGRVREAMTSDPVTVDVEDTVLEAAQRMRRHAVKRLPVLEGGAMVGIVTHENLLRPIPTG